jgi:hypothetical protein
VRLKHSDGREIEMRSTGDGPVDAALKAIERATGVDVVLRKFEVRSVSAGEDAQGEALVTWSTISALTGLERQYQHRRVRNAGLPRSDQPHRARIRHARPHGHAAARAGRGLTIRSFHAHSRNEVHLVQRQAGPWEKATVHVLSHALHYGSSVFEGVRAYETPRGPAIFRLQDHTQRLFDSAKIYRIHIPFTEEQLSHAQREVIRAERPGARRVPAGPWRSAATVKSAWCRDRPTVDVAVAAWEWARYLGAAEDRRRRCLRVLVATRRAEHHPGHGEGRRQLPVEPADRPGGQASRLRRGASACRPTAP